MAKTARDVLTKINNIKYNNNINYTNIVSKENNGEEDKTSSFCLAKPVQSSEEALASSGTLPSKWRGVKLDLFSNPTYTLKITIVRHDGSRFSCSSQLNSPRTHVFRGRDQGHGSKTHWQLVEYLMELRNDYDYRISKVSKPRKGGTIEDFVCLIYLQDLIWHCNLVFEHKIWSFRLDKPVSQLFMEKNGIATGYYGVTVCSKPWANKEDLGI